MDPSHFEANLCYLSTLGRYNTERQPLIRQFFDQRLLEGNLSTDEVDIEDVREFAKENSPEQHSDGPEFNEIFKQVLLTLPEDINPQDFQQYLLFRYDHLEQSLSEAGHFAIYDLLSFEALLRDTVLEETGAVLSATHRFNSKEEFVELASIHEPSDQFTDEWHTRIKVDVQQILNEFVERTLPDDPTLGPKRVKERIATGQEILRFLSSSANQRGSIDFLSNPLYKVYKNGSKVLIPFPEVLLTTAQYRIEAYVGQFDEVQELENNQKGNVVEELAHTLLQQIPCQNFVKNLHYIHDPNPGEADGILFFEDAYWPVEVKSHPIFRKIPRQIELVKERYLGKVTKAIDQTRKANDYLSSVDEFGLIYNLTGHKNPDNMEQGGIVVLDGFIPTLYSGNERADSHLGMSEIHEKLSPEDRQVVLTLYDLFQLLQEEETEHFDEFLHWRTNHTGKFPIWGYNEREYWAFYFDNYRSNDECKEKFKTAVDKEIITFYISKRFNDKPHLENLVQ